jgi:hypothetical protein
MDDSPPARAYVITCHNQGHIVSMNIDIMPLKIQGKGAEGWKKTTS